MRPSRLVVQNFGPYRERTEIDFSRLAPVFLVWGKTGSGKTSLFDAMTYALYGEAPGSRSGFEKQLWSHHALPGEKPLVEFEFRLGEDEYRAVRSPPHKRRKKNGDLTDIGPEAAIWRRVDEAQAPEGLFDGDRPAQGPWRLLADKITEVNAVVLDKVGLTEDEFSKIVLLPQGEFQRFLEMDSSARVTVLEKLFPVKSHDAVARLAKDRAREALAALQRIDAELERLGLEGGHDEIEADYERLGTEVEELLARRSSAFAELSRTEGTLRLAREAQERARRAEEAKERLDALEAGAAAAEENDRRIAAARAAATAWPRVEAATAAASALAGERAELGRRAAALEELESRGEAMREAEGRAAALGEESARLDGELGALGKAAEAWAGMRAAADGLEKARLAEEAAKGEVESARREESSAKADFSTVAVKPEDEVAVREAFEAARSAQEKSAELVRATEALAALADKADRLAIEAKAKEAEAGRSEADLEAARSRLAELEALAAKGMAATLARNLLPGEPCPVCGSREHPSAETAPISPIGAAEIAKGRAALDAALSRRASAGALAESSLALQAEARRELEAMTDALRSAHPGDLPDPTESKAELSRRGLASSAAAKALREMEDRRKKALACGARLERSRILLAEAESALAAAGMERSSLEASLAAARSHAGSEDPASRIAAIRLRREAIAGERLRIEDEVAAWKRSREKAAALDQESRDRLIGLESSERDTAAAASAAVSAAGFSDARALGEAILAPSALALLEAQAAERDRALASVRAELRALGESGGDVPLLDMEELEAAATSARAALDELQGRLDLVQAEKARVARLREDRGRLIAERAELAAKSSGLNSLSLLLNGEMPGRRLPFKNFVLAMYFRVVVERAGARLFQMSDGRYSLAADEGQASGRGKIGLDLLVRDSYTGQSRSAGTLSGGERFLTALSLALGLADTIRERSGGVALDAVFIDEGFGSLDDEALDRAVSVLDKARGARMIGIVSHVAELRSRIPSRIEVTKGRGGSSLVIVG